MPRDNEAIINAADEAQKFVRQKLIEVVGFGAGGETIMCFSEALNCLDRVTRSLEEPGRGYCSGAIEARGELAYVPGTRDWEERAISAEAEVMQLRREAEARRVVEAAS